VNSSFVAFHSSGIPSTGLLWFDEHGFFLVVIAAVVVAGLVVAAVDAIAARMKPSVVWPRPSSPPVHGGLGARRRGSPPPTSRLAGQRMGLPRLKRRLSGGSS
jgi:hypothetical protein